jgi:hypothetical protein
MMFVDPDGEFITFGIGSNGFSIGLNFFGFGFGINVGWSGGGSIGAYVEMGPRIGPIGATATQSFDYGFKSGDWSYTMGMGIGMQAGPTNVGAGVSLTSNLSTGQSALNWGVGIGVGGGNGMVGGGIGVGYGSNGWNWSASGYYRPGPPVMDISIPDGFNSDHDWRSITDVDLNERIHEVFGRRYKATLEPALPSKKAEYFLRGDGMYNKHNLEYDTWDIVGGTYDLRDGRISVSPFFASHPDVVWFKAIAGHELLHAYHHSEHGAGYMGAVSEAVSTRYTGTVLDNVGYPLGLEFLNEATRIQQGFRIEHPIYKNIPSWLW